MTEVLSVSTHSEGSSYFTHNSRGDSSSFLVNSPTSYAPTPSKPRAHVKYDIRSVTTHPRTSESEASTRSSLSSTPASSFSLDSRCETDEDDQIVFPSYDDVGFLDNTEDLEVPSSTSNVDTYTDYSTSTSTDTTSNIQSRPDSPELIPKTTSDDTAVRNHPSRHVDYLSHDWKEEDIWSSWRHIVSKRKVYSNSARLENASWRTWTKSKNKLRTISPEALNWMKDYDVTWLYGPLQTGDAMTSAPAQSPAEPRLSTSNSFLNKKPILKKRSVSEIMLSRSLSTSSLVQQAAAAVQAQQNDRRPKLARATSDFVTYPFPSTAGSDESTNAFPSSSSSGLQTPGISGERKHIHWNDKVEQCIAVDIKEGDDDDAEEDYSAIQDDDSSSDDGLIMMKTTSKIKLRSRSGTPRNSFSSESKTIAMLPSTTLRGDTPEPPEKGSSTSHSIWGSGRLLSPSPSQETLRPAKPSRNFLLDDEDEDADIAWEPSGAFSGRRDNVYTSRDRLSGLGADEEGPSHEGLRRTPSGMFMPIEEDEDDVVAAGLFGKAVDTVNTFKDIAHVIWNVGWRR